MPGVEETPQFFVPPEGVEQAFFPHVGENFFLRKDVEAEFYLFELVGEIIKGFLPAVPVEHREQAVAVAGQVQLGDVLVLHVFTPALRRQKFVCVHHVSFACR